MQRLVVYFHYDPRGQADPACRFAVREIQKQARAVWFVTNGRLDAESRGWARDAGLHLLERENTGFDVGAYRQVLLALGRPALDEWDEIVLMNYTLAGPVFPLGEMFAAMDARALDFWGLSRHYAMRSRRFGGRGGAVPEHLQSHLLAVRRPMYDDFFAYWQAMTLPRSYEESVRCHEARFTAHFAALGYRWDSFLDGERWRGIFLNPLMACPRELLQQERCPFFKRRSFFTPYGDELRRTDGLAARRLYDWLKAETSYPVDELLRGLLPAYPLSAVTRSLHPYPLLPADPAGPAPVTVLPPAALREGAALAPDRFYWLELPLPETEPARRYEAAARWTPAQQAAAVRLLEQNPLWGLIGPALPLYPGCEAARLRAWRRDRPAVQARMAELGLQLPLDAADPPPLPAGGVLLRGAAFPGGLPPVERPEDFWLLPLAAQQGGWAVALAQDAAQAAARADQLGVLLAAQLSPQGAARALARALRSALRR